MPARPGYNPRRMPTAPRRLILLGKPDCHLCHAMRAVAVEVVGHAAIDERDVREHPSLERRYVFEIPVLLWEDHEVARHRISAAQLRARLHELGWG